MPSFCQGTTKYFVNIQAEKDNLPFISLDSNQGKGQIYRYGFLNIKNQIGIRLDCKDVSVTQGHGMQNNLILLDDFNQNLIP